MAELKTKKTKQSVKQFLDGIADKKRRQDCIAISKLMSDVTGDKPKMWGSEIVGFGNYHYKYKSGREGDWFVTGFSPRKQNLTLYIMSGFEQHGKLMQKLGKFKTGKSCLYISKIEDIDMMVLKDLVRKSVAHMAIVNKQATK